MPVIFSSHSTNAAEFMSRTAVRIAGGNFVSSPQPSFTSSPGAA